MKTFEVFFNRRTSLKIKAHKVKHLDEMLYFVDENDNMIIAVSIYNLDYVQEIK